MSGTPPPLNSNPLALIRALPTRRVRLDQIAIPEGLAHDEIFLSRYTAFLSGKVPTHETRISLDRIRRGFWKQDAGKWALQCDPVSEAKLEYAIELIRLGDRPALHLYDNPNPDDPRRFVCADDVTSHAAYEKLGIAKVPVVLMAKPRNLEESCLSVRCFRRGKMKETVPLSDGVVPFMPDFVPSILGTIKPQIGECLNQLLAALGETKNAIKQFHQAGATTLHYHHTLYSIILRAEDCVASIRMLLEAKKPLTAAGLLRSLYELALVFYVDWLAPGHTYRYLQMASVMSEKDWEARCEEWRKSDIAAGASILEAKNIRDAHMRAFRLACMVGEKARLFPLGEKFQREIYSFLSDVIHHDFSMTARYTHTLDHGDEVVYNEDAMNTIVHVTDLLVAAMVSRIRDDIGFPKQASVRDR